jgi:hypothetical protein
LKSGFGENYFFLSGNNLSVEDYGGISITELISYSNFNAENRVTNAVDLSIDPFVHEGINGGMNILWSDKRSGNAELFINEFNSNNKANSGLSKSSRIKSSGKNAQVYGGTNTLVDASANFFDDGVYVGDFLNIVSGSEYSARKLPVVSVINNSTIEVGAFFEKNEADLGYFIDTTEINSVNDVPIQLTNLRQSSSRPVAVSDASGDMHIVWQSLDGDFYNIYYKRYRSSLPKEQIWGSVQLTKDEGHSINPSIGIDKKSNLHLVWEDERSKDHAIMYSRSNNVLTDSRDPKFVYWTSGNYNGRDILLSKDIYSENPSLIVDRNDVVHIVFAGRTDRNVDSVYEIFYINNKNGFFSNPVRITNLLSHSKHPQIVDDAEGNLYVIFSSNQENIDEIFLSKYDISDDEWKSPKKLNSTSSESVRPSVTMDPDGVIYIFWLEKSEPASTIKFVEYNSVNDEIEIGNKNVSSSSSTASSLGVSIDRTKTVHVSWEDVRDFIGIEDEEGSEIFKNQIANLVTCQKIQEETGVSNENQTEDEIIQEQLSQLVIGNTFPDDVTSSQLAISDESVRDVLLTFETDTVSYDVPIDLFNQSNPLSELPPTVMDFRDIRIKIKGLPNTLAYRIKNADDSNSSFSEFFEFTIDEQPNTTVAQHKLSFGNGQKQVCLQLYTIDGLTSAFCHDLFLNESSLFDVILYNDNGNIVGNSVSTEFQNTKVLTSKPYWVSIAPLRVVDDEQKVMFDVVMQGQDILNVDTEEQEDGTFIGKFTLQTHDGVLYLDGDAKIVPKIVNK